MQRAMAIIAPGIFLSQAATTTRPSMLSPKVTVSMESAITSRLTRDAFMPSVPMDMPSLMVIVCRTGRERCTLPIATTAFQSSRSIALLDFPGQLLLPGSLRGSRWAGEAKSGTLQGVTSEARLPIRHSCPRSRTAFPCRRRRVRWREAYQPVRARPARSAGRGSVPRPTYRLTSSPVVCPGQGGSTAVVIGTELSGDRFVRRSHIVSPWEQPQIIYQRAGSAAKIWIAEWNLYQFGR